MVYGGVLVDTINRITKIIKEEPLETLEEIARKTNKELNREDITRWDIERALENIPYC